MSTTIKNLKSNFFDKIHFLIASGLYSGLSPVAPGTVGSLVVLLFLWLIPEQSVHLHLVIIVCLYFIGVWSSSNVAQKIGKDPSLVVIDEMAGMWIPLAICPKRVIYYLIAFLLFRLLDIVKPFPIKRIERFPGGWGIMTDDVIAGFYAAIGIELLLRTGL